jgi:hypothetical protein
MVNRTISGALMICISLLIITGCTEETETSLAPYQGQRALEIIKITRSPRPDIQWLGGRVAAVGVNEGDQAAMDSTLVWLTTAETDTLSSYQTFGTNTDESLLATLGAVPADSLDHDAMYTIWLATEEAFSASLDTAFRDENTFIDTTFAAPVYLRGKSWGERSGTQVIVDLKIEQVESMLDNFFILTWTPATLPFRQLAIRKAAVGGFEDLVWHILTPDSLDDNIYPPLIIGSTVPGTDELVAWDPAVGFLPDEEYPSVGEGHVLWMTNSKWTGAFSRYETGYAWFLVYVQ